MKHLYLAQILLFLLLFLQRPPSESKVGSHNRHFFERRVQCALNGLERINVIENVGDGTAERQLHERRFVNFAGAPDDLRK